MELVVVMMVVIAGGEDHLEDGAIQTSDANERRRRCAEMNSS